MSHLAVLLKSKREKNETKNSLYKKNINKYEDEQSILLLLSILEIFGKRLMVLFIRD